VIAAKAFLVAAFIACFIFGLAGSFVVEAPKIKCTMDQRNRLLLSPEFLACEELYRKSCYELAKEKFCAPISDAVTAKGKAPQ
jgi:hypothetical protein